MSAVKVKQFESPPGAEIMGIGVMGVFENLATEAIDPILKKYDLRREDIDPNEWYDLQLYFDLYREIAEDPSNTMTLVAIGKAIAKNVTDPEEIGDLETFVNDTLNATATGVIRNTPPGYGYIIEKTDDNTYHITNNTGSSNDVVYGYIWESVRMLAGTNTAFSFKPVENYGTGGDEGSTFYLSWK